MKRQGEDVNRLLRDSTKKMARYLEKSAQFRAHTPSEYDGAYKRTIFFSERIYKPTFM